MERTWKDPGKAVSNGGELAMAWKQAGVSGVREPVGGLLNGLTAGGPIDATKGNCFKEELTQEVSPRKRILNVSRSVWKQANVTSDLWEKLTARCVDRHRHMERTLERLLQTQSAMEELAMALEQAEGVRDAWEPLFKEELTQVKEGMKHINDLAHELAISDVHLSMDNSRSLEHLNSRWKLLQPSGPDDVLGSSKNDGAVPGA
ncbi:unnamed protein product, partial [Coregonus sp. 'balchen']